MCTFYKIWLLSLILVHVLKGWFVKTIHKTNKKKTIWNNLCFFLLKVTYKMECGLGLWEIYGFCFLLELWLAGLSHTAAFRDNISRKHYPTTNPIKLEEIYSFLIKLCIDVLQILFLGHDIHLFIAMEWCCKCNFIVLVSSSCLLLHYHVN